MEALTTFCFAPEIEQALVSLCFAAPERIATLKRELDLSIHITQPHLRHILEGIELAYREVGESDFATVIQILRELGVLEDCGNLAGVNQVFEGYRYGFASPEVEEQIFNHYLQMLKAYALARSSEPPVAVYHFSGGKATTLPNKLKARDSDPDEIGQALVRGHLYTVKMWRTPEFTNLRLYPKL